MAVSAYCLLFIPSVPSGEGYRSSGQVQQAAAAVLPSSPTATGSLSCPIITPTNSTPRPQKPKDPHLDETIKMACWLHRRVGEHMCFEWASVDLTEIVRLYDVRHQKYPQKAKKIPSHGGSASFDEDPRFPPGWGSENTCASCKRDEKHRLRSNNNDHDDGESGGDDRLTHISGKLPRTQGHEYDVTCPTRDHPLDQGLWEALQAFLGPTKPRETYVRYFGALNRPQGPYTPRESEYEREDRETRTRRIEKRCTPYWYKTGSMSGRGGAGSVEEEEEAEEYEE